MLNRMRIAPRMALMIAAGAGCILAIVIAYNYISARRLLEDELRLKAQFLAQATAYKIESIERPVEKVVLATAYMLYETERNDEQLYKLLEALLAYNPEIYGAAIAPRPKGKAPYVWRAAEFGQPFLRGDLNANDYNYETWDWYSLPGDLGRAIWTEPYFDEGGGGVLMVTRASPFYKKGATNELAGIVTSDVSLEWLRDMLAKLQVGRAGFAILISATGAVLSHPDTELIMNESIFSLAEERADNNLRKIGQRMLRGETGFSEVLSPSTGKKSWMAFAPVPATGWAVGLVFPQDELLGVVFELSRKSLIFGITGFVFLLLIAVGIARSITRPIRRLEHATHAVAAGNLDAPMPTMYGEDEVASLAAAFAKMCGDLKQHIEDLRLTTAAKERIENEMKIARDIQMSLVPRTFPPFPTRNDMEIFAILEPARQIGGDFYDFFLSGPEELCIVVGDVSGKGIPAALFMAVTRTLLRSLWQEERNPTRTLARLNVELAKENDSCMFVTHFCAMINLETGKCSYANGGHNPPFLLRAGSKASYLPKVKGMVVGGMAESTFEQGEITLQAGDRLFIYTDGVTEAMDSEGNLSGDDWTLAKVNEFQTLDPTAMIKAMCEALKHHTRGAEQSDDITMLAFQYMGRR